jgi:GR25 family glycosyltransferase involved in LPS biosynthesis
MAQHSMFSSGVANTSLAVAELMREFGHEVDLIQTAGAATWWDDCKSLAEKWRIVTVADAKDYDLVIEIDRLMLLEDMRKRIAKTSVLVLRKPFILHELEAVLFPTVQTQKREFAGLKEIWMMDAAAAMEEGSVQALELLSNLPVRIVPYMWTASIASTHMQEGGLGSWLDFTVAELKRIDSSGATMPPWTAHVAETNTSNASCTVLPLVILREAKRRGTPIGKWQSHNTDMLTKSKFFMENIVKNTVADMSGEFIGRQRCVEWLRDPMSFVLSHMRFSVIRPMLFDVAWAGIPLVHNSSVLRDLGCGLENTYYSDNHVGEACDAIRRMEQDLVTIKGIFAPGATQAVQAKILERYSPLSANVKVGWQKVVEGLGAHPLVQPKLKGKALRIGFCDMWEDFVPEYNFFTLMLAAANPLVEVVGEPASAASDVILFGPFGQTWKSFSQPKIHFTGENTPPVREANLNLGFHHFDMTTDGYLRFPLWLLEIDWFGADVKRIVNPKPIPLERCTKVYAPELTQKKEFCAFVVSNPSNPVRNAAYQWLSEYKPIASAGRLYNNTGPDLFAGGGGGGGELAKHEFLKRYKFCLAYENNSADGYVTEKYLHAKAAGCIPIYWGDPKMERDFNLAGAIDARKFKSPEELVAAVRSVDTDDSEWLKRYSVPALEPYRVVWAQRTMAECAKRIFALGGFDPNSLPDVLAYVAPASPAVPVVPATPVAPAVPATPAPVPAAPQELEVPHMVTCATRKFLPSLQHWLIAIATQTGAMPDLKATVFLGADVPSDTAQTLKDKFTFATFETLPDTTADSFPDFWAPEHYGWKLWILDTMCSRLPGRLIMYTDAGSFLCRWPKEWMLKAQAAGLCLLEDPREENRRWCSADFCAIVKPTEAELAAQQRLGGLVAFRAGADLPRRVFQEALALGKQRAVLVGPKWTGPNTGHRHDQSILSIVSLRHSVPACALDTVYCDISLRKTFTSGRAIYVHRGNFQVHRPFAEKIDDAFVINLDRRADRMAKLPAELRARAERWPAIDGRALTLTPALKRLLKPNDFFWKKAVTGCALSHLGLWSKLAAENPDIENYLIMEDDVKLRPDWEVAWKEAADDVPEDYDIIYLGGVLPPNRQMFEKSCKDRVNDSFCRIKENTVWGQSSPNRYFHFCAYAYILSKRGAQKVLGLINSSDGFWTSADHVLCNPVTVLKAYVFEPMIAGCYQDDDPAYANSQFNDFSRVDGFDSDLWNNNERFTDDPAFSTECEGELDIAAALRDARAAPKALHPVVKPAVAAPEPVKPEGRRFVALDKQKLDITHLYESKWLQHIFGDPKMFIIDPVNLTTPPPTDRPVVIIQKPHIEALTAMMEKWDSYGAKFSILHLSDEHLDDDISAYSLQGCERVLRFYLRPGMPEKVTTIPLGYHWTLNEGSKNMLNLTPRLPFRSLTWSFFGTDWQGRRAQLEPLFTVAKHDAQFFKNWNDSAALKAADYITTMLDSIFVPCPDGMNPETFRFYEALECGCVPILVRTEANAAWVDWVTEHVPVLPSSSWADAVQLVNHLMAQKPMLEAYRTKVLEGWIGWRAKLRAEATAWLSS